MGLPIGDLRSMSLWQFSAYAEGFAVANGASDGLAEEDVAAISDALDEVEGLTSDD